MQTGHLSAGSGEVCMGEWKNLEELKATLKTKIKRRLIYLNEKRILISEYPDSINIE